MERNYETIVILKPDLSEQEGQEVFDKITKKITSLEGKVIDSKIWDKERDFYFFLRGRGADKTKYYKGCYWFVSFDLAIDKMFDLKELIRLEERILRNLIVSRKEQAKPKLSKKVKAD